MLDEFKKFIFKGNVVDLATGVIIGGAFSTIVGAFTKGFVEPLIKVITGAKDVNVPWTVGPFDMGLILSSIINFLIVAAVVFLFIVKPANKMLAALNKPAEPAGPPPPTPTEALLAEIRDSLKQR